MPIRESDIRALASSQSYERGQEYFYSECVTEIQKCGHTLSAEVEGSGYAPYHVKIELNANEEAIVTTSCTCPYDFGGICKHRVAVLLSYIDDLTVIDERPAVEELLAEIKEADLRRILIHLLETEPRLFTQVEAEIATLKIVAQTGTPTQTKKSSPPSKKASIPLDVSSFKRQAQQILRGSGYNDYYDGGWDISSQFSTLFNQAQPLLEAGDGRNALLMLDAVMEPFVDCWFEYDHEGEVAEVFYDIAPLFSEAILSAELSKKEKTLWKNKLNDWQAEVSDYGVDEVFDAPLEALEQGWDYAPLQAVLQGGKFSAKEAAQGHFSAYNEDLSIVRLHILEREGRLSEYLNLAKAAGLTENYLSMLVKLERSAEAVEYALKYVASAQVILSLALALHEKGLIDDALKIAEHGLTLQNEKLPLARWLRDEAQKHANVKLALRAAKAAFLSSSTLEDYVAVESLAGAEWATLKPELLRQLLSGNINLYGKIDIYLHEGMYQEATKAIDKERYLDYATIEKAVDAVYQEFPDWAIKHCKAQAEPNMDQGKSKYYHHCVRWVEKAGKAYLAANRAVEWHEYLEGLIKKHQRKYSLRPQLEALRTLSVTKAV